MEIVVLNVELRNKYCSKMNTNEHFYMINNKMTIQATVFVVTLLCMVIFLNNTTVSNCHFLPYCFFVIFSGIICILVCLKYQQRDWRITELSIAILFSIIIVAMRNIGNSIETSLYYCSVVLVIITMCQLRIKVPAFALAVCVVCVIEAGIVWLQFMGALPAYTQYYRATGTFDNPNACGLFFSFSFPFIVEKYKTDKSLFVLLIGIVSILTCIVLRCRMSIIVIVLLLVFHYRNHLLHLSIPSKLLAVSCCMTLILILLIFMKEGSTKGRMLICQVTYNLIKDIPITGYGTYGFTKHYMPHQAEYLSQQPIFAMFADTPMHPLNEYIALVVNIGIGALCILIVLCITIKKQWNSTNASYQGFLIAIAVSSLFTYSFRYAFTWVFLVVCATQSGGCKIIVHRMAKLIILPVCISVFTLLYLLYWVINFELTWRFAYDKFNNNEQKEHVLQDYKCLSENKYVSPPFHFNHAAVLNDYGNYADSNIALDKFDVFFCDYEAIMLRANNYYVLREYDKAIFFYQKAHAMCPTRFLPLQGLMRTYKRKGNSLREREVAKVIIDTPVKIHSYTITLIKKEAQNIIEPILKPKK